MPVREMVTHVRLIPVFNASISSDTDTNTSGVDTADYDLGTTWFFQATAYTDGNYAIGFEESDASNFTGATDVPAEKIVGPTGATLTTAQQQVTAVTPVDGTGSAVRLGVHSTKRYVRAVITSTSVTTGATLNVACLVGPEVIPAEA